MRVYSVSSGGASPSGLPRRRSQRIERPQVSVWAFGYTHYLTERRRATKRAGSRLLTSRDTIELATIESARVAHLDSKIGTLTPGKEADIVMLATDRINVFPLNNAPGAVVTLMDTSNVEHVFIAGKVMKWRGRLVDVDLNRIRRLTEKARDGLLARTNYPRDLF